MHEPTPPLPQSPNVPMTTSPMTPFFHFFHFFRFFPPQISFFNPKHKSSPNGWCQNPSDFFIWENLSSSINRRGFSTCTESNKNGLIDESLLWKSTLWWWSFFFFKNNGCIIKRERGLKMIFLFLSFLIC